MMTPGKFGARMTSSSVSGSGIGRASTMLDANSLTVNVEVLHTFLTHLLDVLNSKLDVSHEVDKDFLDVFSNIRSLVSLLPKLLTSTNLSDLITDPAMVLDMGSIKGNLIGQDLRVFWDFLQHGYKQMAADSPTQAMTWLFSIVQTVRASVADHAVAERCAKQVGVHGPSFIKNIKDVIAGQAAQSSGQAAPSLTWKDKING